VSGQLRGPMAWCLDKAYVLMFWYLVKHKQNFMLTFDRQIFCKNFLILTVIVVVEE